MSVLTCVLRSMALPLRNTAHRGRTFSSKAYSKTHEWVDSKTGNVGISHFAQGELGDVVYVDLPRVGSTFKAGDVFGSVESVKAASDVYSPVSGEIAEVNDELLKNPAMINDDPEGAGWMIKMKLSPGAETEINSMMEDKDYIEFTSKH
uniref:Glycine cleavage system H protein n=1 Tax=Spongospora subterranea TaxID=70186 RepID=A0A0H5QKI9_9EUKA|eukprot:CRZ01811.1 hypothetical protein [Spongospora subterranea]